MKKDKVNPGQIEPVVIPWISVNDRLPATSLPAVMVVIDMPVIGNMFSLGHYFPEKKKWRLLKAMGYKELNGVTHWHPIPKLPDEG